MTRTVKRKPLSQKLEIALWRAWGIVPCAKCGALCARGAFRVQGINVRTFEWEHALALVNGGKDDFDEIRPWCSDCHKPKSAREHRENCKTKRIAKKRTQPKRPSLLRSRGFDKRLSKKFDGRVVRRTPAT